MPSGAAEEDSSFQSANHLVESEQGDLPQHEEDEEDDRGPQGFLRIGESLLGLADLHRYRRRRAHHIEEAHRCKRRIDGQVVDRLLRSAPDIGYMVRWSRGE